MEINTIAVIFAALAGVALGFWLGIQFSHWMGKRILERATGKEFEDLIAEIERDIKSELGEDAHISVRTIKTDASENKAEKRTRRATIHYEQGHYYAWWNDNKEFAGQAESVGELRKYLREKHSDIRVLTTVKNEA